jgi:hypothetical protein
MYMIIGVGCLVDLRRDADSVDAERYHTLARASMREFNIMEDVTVEAITALFYEIWYLLVFSEKKKAVGYAWGLMGLVAKMAQSVCSLVLCVLSVDLWLNMCIRSGCVSLQCFPSGSGLILISLSICRSEWPQIQGHT